MKLYTSSLLAFILSAQTATAQEPILVEDQTVKAAKMGTGIYTDYVITWNSSTDAYEYAGCCSNTYQLTFSDYSTGHKKFEFLRVGSTSAPNVYVPDEEAYPVTFIRGRYIGDQAQIDKYQAIDLSEEERIVFLDEWVYILTDWKSKDSYVIEKVLCFGEITGGAAYKEAFAAKKKMTKANHPVVLQAYLDEAFKKQAELLPKWREENQSIIDKRELNKKMVYAEIDGENAEYWNSPEGQRKLAEWGQAKIILINDTEADFLLYYGQNISEVLEPGEKVEFSCTGGKVYQAEIIPNSPQLKATDVVLIDLNGQNCGATLHVSGF